MPRDVGKINPNNPVKTGGAVVGGAFPTTYFNEQTHLKTNDLNDTDAHRFNDFDNINRSQLASTGDYTISNANSEALLTFPAEGKISHVVGGIHWSYDGDPVGTGILQIKDSGSVVFYTFVTNKGPGFFPFAPPKRGVAGNPMLLSLSTGGSGIKGTVGALTHWIE